MNPNLTITGSGDFSLLIGQTTIPSAETEYDLVTAMFGNLTKTTIKVEQERKIHYGSYRGVRIKDKVKVVQVESGYEIETDEIDARALRAAYFASQGSPTGTSPDYDTFDPFDNPQGLRGMARLRMWDVEDRINPALMHKDFYCAVTVEGDVELGEEDAKVRLRIDVLSPVGTVYRKQVS